MYTVPFLEAADIFTNIDIRFAGFLVALSGNEDPAVPLAAALASSHTRSGDVCVDLAVYAGSRLSRKKERPNDDKFPSLQQWRETLLKSGVVGEPGEYRPLIIDKGNRLYLYRYWMYEKKLAEFFLERTIPVLFPVDPDAVKHGLERLFPEMSTAGTDWQKVAAMVALLKNICIISGGPGTGKTFAVARILAFLLEQSPAGNLSIYLAAPTGKAASRLTESIDKARRSLPCSGTIKAAIPDKGFTLHRMLRSSGNTSRFYYHAENRLPADIVVVDEASMVDLPLMSKLVQALAPATRLLLLGDRDQLASVEAGSVMGDICGDGRENIFSGHFRKHLKTLGNIELPEKGNLPASSPGLQDCRVYFSKSYRFDDQSGIPALSRLINGSRKEKMIELLREGSYADVHWRSTQNRAQAFAFLEEKIIRHYRALAEAREPAHALDCLGQFRILCAVNHGPYGVRELNQRAREVLKIAHGPAMMGSDDWYHGRPILIRKNDYRLELFNGDTGIVMRNPDDGNVLTVFFAGSKGEIRQFAPDRLPEHETVYAMTIHKSQGSEFEDVLLVLPEKDTPILTKELVYTGITRARRNLSILCSESVINLAVSRRIDRTSGLRDKLSCSAAHDEP